MDSPLEIVYKIYDHADLESCVNLREVNSYWYQAFNQIDERVMKRKVRERNPWMKPGEDGTEMKTWADCARVFVGRLRSDKWEAVDSTADIQLPKKPSDSTPLDAVETETTLPEDYQPLMRMRNRPEFNRKLGADGFLMDVRTMSVTRAADEPSPVTHLKITDDMFECIIEGRRVILPAYLSDLTRENVRAFEPADEMTLLDVRTSRYCEMWFFPADTLDYRHGFKWDGAPREGYRFEVFTNGCTLHTPTISPPWRLVVDMENLRIIHIPSATPRGRGIFDMAFSIYSGLLWMTEHPQELGLCIVPILVDLNDVSVGEDKRTHASRIYYRKDRILGFSSSLLEEGERRVPEGHQRYLVLGASFPLYDSSIVHDRDYVVDLATSEVITVETPRIFGFRDSIYGFNLFVGFSKGKMGAWYYRMEVFKRLWRQLSLMRQMRPDQEEYDLSIEMGVEDYFELA